MTNPSFSPANPADSGRSLAPLRCPTKQAPDLPQRLPRHCAACQSHQPPLGCTWPAWSDHTKTDLAARFVATLHYTQSQADHAVERMEHRAGPTPVQLALFIQEAQP